MFNNITIPLLNGTFVLIISVMAFFICGYCTGLKIGRSQGRKKENIKRIYDETWLGLILKELAKQIRLQNYSLADTDQIITQMSKDATFNQLFDLRTSPDQENRASVIPERYTKPTNTQ